jgi:hypothetical protein
MEMHRIRQISIAKPGPLDFNVASSWRSMWEATLDDGRNILMDRRDIGGIVPIAGDWVYFQGNEPHVFQLCQVTRVRGDCIELSNGECVDSGRMYVGNAIPVVGDYVERRSDGLHVIRQRYFEEKHGHLIESVKEAEAQEKYRKRTGIPG